MHSEQPTPGRPTIATIDLEALAENFLSVKRFVGSDVKYMAVVKANAYGHGAVECSKRLEAEGVDWFAVALIEEAVGLRNAGISKPILCLGGIWPGQEASLFTHSITPVIFRLGQVQELDRAAAAAKKLDVHLKIDTGMGRVGLRPDELDAVIEELTNCKNIRLNGVMTHFAVADDLEQSAFTNNQIDSLNIAVGRLRKAGFSPEHIDMANSPGAIAFPRSKGTMVRLGGVLYGLGGDVLPRSIEKPELTPVMSLRTRIAQIKTVPAGETLGYGRTFITARESRIAVIPIGYNDGYRRALSNAAKAIVGGKFVDVVGRVSMDWTLIDVTEVSEAAVGDEVVMIGSDGENAILAEDLARICSTISYEITCGITSRVRRIYSQRI